MITACERASFWEGAIVILEETLGGRATISDECRRNNYEHYSFVFLTLYNIYIPLYKKIYIIYIYIYIAYETLSGRAAETTGRSNLVAISSAISACGKASQWEADGIQGLGVEGLAGDPKTYRFKGYTPKFSGYCLLVCRVWGYS